MRKLLALAIFSLLSASAFGACSNTSFGNGFTCIQQKSGGNGGSGTSFNVTLGSTTTAGHQVVVRAFICADVSCVGSTSATTLTPSDGTSDTFTAAPNSPYTMQVGGGVANSGKIGIWAIKSVGATTSFTVTCSATCWYLTVGVSEWTGINNTTPFDSGVGAAASQTSNVTSASVTGGTSTNAVDLVLGYIALSVGNAVTPGTGFTEIGEDITGDEWEAKSVTSTGSQACTWTFASAQWEAACVALQAAGAGPATVRHRSWVISQ